jgi:ribose 5-phosphate isomerase A
MSDTRDALKREVAAQAAAMVEDGMVVGLGTGSTAAFFIESLIGRAKQGLNILCIPTSERSAAQARAGGLKIVGFDTHTSIDICIDGADEIKRDNLDLVKGLGGALFREKIVASAAKKLVIIADQEKLVDWLGTRSPVPVEVTRFGWELTQSRLLALAEAATRREQSDGEAYVTDGGNYIIDCSFAPIENAGELNRKLLNIVGVVETGLFVGMATLALVADGHGVTRYTPK